MPILLSVILAALFFSSDACSEEEGSSHSTVQDLSFLIGTWEITFEIYDTYTPGKRPVFTEKGTQTCEFDLGQDGIPMFVTCRGEVTSDHGRTRTFQESIRYGNFACAFERVGLFSNWPATSLETLYHDPAKRTLEIRGKLDVQDGMLERYEDIYQFDETCSSYVRRNVANFSDMPVTEFNLTLAGTGKKIK